MKNKLIYGIIIAISLALAVYCGYVFCTQLYIEDGGLPALIGVYIVSVAVSIVVIDVLHECGHFIIGNCLSMGVKMPKIKPLSSSSVDINPKGDKHIKMRMLITTLSGSLFPFLCIILGILALAVPSVSLVFCVLLPFSFYHFAINILPMELNSGKTDGMVAWEIITNKPTAQVMLAILRVQGSLRKGKKLEEVDESLILDLPQLQEDDINFIILTQLRYEYYLAKGDDSNAYKYFNRYKDLIQYLPSEYKK
jgi:hypothetical protein